jgi:hypothetical protein
MFFCNPNIHKRSEIRDQEQNPLWQRKHAKIETFFCTTGYANMEKRKRTSTSLQKP